VSTVAVIGAGLAGLAAADALAQAGIDVTVMEQRDRVGGRVWSIASDDGTVVEMGAEFVTEGYQEVPELITRLGLRLAPMGMSFARRQPRGGIGVGDEQLERSLEVVEAALADGAAADVTVDRLLAGLPLHAGARELIACRIQVSYAHETSRIAAAAVRDVGHLFREAEARRVAGGNGQIAERLAAPLRVLRSTPAREVRATDGGYTVNGELHADAVVVAAPAFAVNGISFDPPLPAWKRAAQDEVVYGHAAKLAVPLGRAAPPSSVISVPEHFWAWTANGPDGSVVPLVAAFAGSATAVEAMYVEDGPGGYLSRVAALRPDLDLRAEDAVLSTWPDGAYSAREAGRAPDLDERLTRPVGRIVFAGEHTEPVWYATMEGALRSGARAAADVVAMLGVRSADRGPRTGSPR
jgi:monoamine oxidase